MGEVYLAEDLKLSRKVALKILPTEIAEREDRLRRFHQEARAASALNHPNILTVHDFGEIEGVNFLATEYIDGETLRDTILDGPLEVETVVDIAIQVTSALAAAHEAGILHRDIKPENIMIRRDRIVKVLDFGLAKLSEFSMPAGKPTGSEDNTMAQVKTEPGMIMGTANYMSPEQARGKLTDTRSDIWSLGCVMYEMAAGTAPFIGETTADKLAAIIHKDPMPLGRLRRDIPERLDEIISKCLEKDTEDRYQSIKDLLVDLRRFRKRHDIDLSVERTQPPDKNRTQVIEAAHSLTGQIAATQSSAEYIASGIRSHKLMFAGMAFLLVAGMVAGSVLWYRSRQESVATRGDMKITRLVTGVDGLLGNATISPDGRFIAYTIEKDGKRGMWVRQVAQQNSVEIVKPVEGASFAGIQFSPDASVLYFVRGDADTDPTNSLYEMPVLGGREPRKIISNVGSAPSLSPDGRQVAFVRISDATGETFVTIVNVDGSGERRIATRAGANWYEAVAWSPGGDRIATAAATTAGATRYTVVEVSVADGKETPVGDHQFPGNIQRIHWLSDGSAMILISSLEGQPQIVEMSYPSGVVSRITNDLNRYGGGVPTADGTTLLASLGEYTTNIWAGTLGEDETKARRLTRGSEDGLVGIGLLSDGKIVYTAREGSGIALMIANPDGSEARQIAYDPYSLQDPAATADGKYIVYTSFQPDTRPHIWRIDVSGANPKQLTFDEDYVPHPSPDSATVFFNSYRSGRAGIWRMPIDGGDPTRVVEPGFTMQVSPDGSQMLYYVSTTEGVTEPVLGVVADGSVTRKLDLPKRADRPVFSADGKNIIYTHRVAGAGNIWSQPIAGGKAVQLTKFTSQWLDRFAIGADGKTFFAARTTGKNDIVLIKDFR